MSVSTLCRSIDTQTIKRFNLSLKKNEIFLNEQ